MGIRIARMLFIPSDEVGTTYHSVPLGICIAPTVCACVGHCRPRYPYL